MRRIFWGFCSYWFLMSPLHYLSGRSDFGFEFAEILVFEKRLPAITDTGSRTSDTVSRRLPESLSQRVADSAYHRYGESTTPRIIESGSRRLCVLVIWGVAIRK
jgi:hypothetical protein